ncbi:MAG TPA: hypothetical protein VFC76_05830 [Oscillospiraceae bacterium]|nr:hypothetical protein [Oscillospiraceae bacterium]
MKHITYVTEKRINAIKKIDRYQRSICQKVVVYVFDKIFSDCGYYGATLKEFEQYLGKRIDNKRESKMYYIQGIHGIEYMTNGNVRYVGTHDLSYVNIDDFNLFVKQVYNS